MPEICPKIAQDISKICLRYAQALPKVWGFILRKWDKMSPGRVHQLGHYVVGEVHIAVGHFVVGTFCLLTGFAPFNIMMMSETFNNSVYLLRWRVVMMNQFGLHGNRDVRREVRPNVSLQRPWSPGSKPPSPSPQPSAPPSKAIPCHLHQPSYHDKCKATLLHFQAYLIFVNFVTPPQIFSPVVNQKYTKKHAHRSRAVGAPARWAGINFPRVLNLQLGTSI